MLNSPVCHVDPTGHSFFSDVGSGFKDIGTGIASGAVSVGEQIKSTAKSWAPYVVDGALIAAGTAILLTVPIGGPASGILGGMLLGAGISGLTYNLEAQYGNGPGFSWKDWGVQMGIGAAAGAITGGFTEGGAGLSGALDLASGSMAKISVMAAFGAAGGVAGGVVGALIANAASHQSLTQGMGTAAWQGAATGGAIGAGGEVGGSLFGKVFGEAAEPAEEVSPSVSRRLEWDYDEDAAVPAPPKKTDYAKRVLKAAKQYLKGGYNIDKALGGPQWAPF